MLLKAVSSKLIRQLVRSPRMDQFLCPQIIIMARKFNSRPPISLSIQKMCIEEKYRSLVDRCSIHRNTLTCFMRLQPSPESGIYHIRVNYKISDYTPQVWLLSPDIEKVNGKYPHHIYGWDEECHPCLCVYYPRYNEWTQQMFIATSFIPWIITWLNTYEYWLVTGMWLYDESPTKEKKEP